jgi:hypothetical protein
LAMIARTFFGKRYLCFSTCLGRMAMDSFQIVNCSKFFLVSFSCFFLFYIIVNMTNRSCQ